MPAHYDRVHKNFLLFQDPTSFPAPFPSLWGWGGPTPKAKGKGKVLGTRFFLVTERSILRVPNFGGNELPLSLRNAKSVDVSKSQLKIYLFKQAYNC